MPATGEHGDARVPLETLTREAFAPFGDVVTAGLGAGRDTNLGTALRFDWSAALENARPGARPNLAVFRSTPQALPFRVTLLERHAHSTQVFAALRAARWLVIVAPGAPDGGPDPAGLRAFVAQQGEAINFRRGTWHHPVIVLDEPAELLMLAWEDGGAGDCEERALARPVRIG
jgi:ureidoglycolate lyase